MSLYATKAHLFKLLYWVMPEVSFSLVSGSEPTYSSRPIINDKAMVQIPTFKQLGQLKFQKYFD